MKYLLTLIVCALLTVSLIFMSEIIMALLPDPNDDYVHWLVVAGFVAVCTLPYLVLVATIWAVIGFTKTVKQWIASNQVDNCPHVMHSRHSKDAEQMRRSYNRAIGYGADPGFAAEITGHDPTKDTELK